MGLSSIATWLETQPPEDRMLVQAAFLAILDGRAPTADDLAAATGVSAEVVRVRLAALTEGGVIVVEPGSDRVAGAWGLALHDSPHTLILRGRRFHTWCAQDAVGIPAALGEAAVVESVCHQCGTFIRLGFDGHSITHQSDPGIRIWSAQPDLTRSLVHFTCSRTNFFCSAPHLEQWRARHPEEKGTVRSLEEALKVGRYIWDWVGQRA